MSDRILDVQLEPNLLFENEASSSDFWDQYFELQKLTTAVDLADGRFSLHIVNKTTGEEHEFRSVRLQSNEGAVAN